MHIYLLTDAIRTLDQNKMSSSSDKYVLNFAKGLARFAKVEILASAIPSGQTLQDGDLVLTGIRPQKVGRFSLSLYKEIDQVDSLKKHREDAVIIFWGYDLRQIVPLLKLKLRYGYRCVPFVFDHHGIAIQDAVFWKKWLADLFFRAGFMTIRHFDACLLFQEDAAKELRLRKPFWVGKPGMVQTHPLPKKEQTGFFHVTFGGTLTKLNGIDVLIEAVSLVQVQGFCLHIYGDGPMRNVVENAAKQNKAIQYHGIVDDCEMQKAYGNSDLLLNLRRTTDHAMKFAFPSKFFECISTGRPVLTSRLLDDEELNQYLYTLDTLTPECIADGINRIYAEQSFALEKAAKAKQYAERNYHYLKETKDVFTFLKRVVFDQRTG